MKLYELNQMYDECLIGSVNLETGEITDERLFELLGEIDEERETKILNVSCKKKAVDYEAAAIAEEIEKLQTRKRVIENQSASLERFILSVLRPEEKLKDSRVSISWRKSESVVVECEPEKLPAKFVKEKITYSADKTAIKEAIKSGVEVPFCKIEQKQNLQIK